MKTDDEVRGDFKEAFDVIDDLNGESSPHLRVVFDDKRCADCGEEGDPRLMSRYLITLFLIVQCPVSSSGMSAISVLCFLSPRNAFSKHLFIKMARKVSL